MAASWEELRVFVVAKTYPTPSTRHEETVCTAGITSDGRWVRLYPVPFRLLTDEQRYAKWTWIRVRAQRASTDVRPESYRIDADSISKEGEVRDWSVRWGLLRPMTSRSLEDIQDANRNSGVSLGMFRPRVIERFRIIADHDWQDTQAKINRLMRQQRIPGMGPSLRPLEALHVKFEYSFRCIGDRCRGHQMCMYDWEIGQAWRTWRHKYRTEESLEQKMRETWVERKFQKRPGYFIVGTMHGHQSTFILIGQFSPPTLVAQTPLRLTE